MDEQLLVTAQAVGPARTETLMGREYRVFPATLVRSQVLNNNLGATFLPAEEIEASVDAWNGIPVVIRHPSKRGVPVSARDPEILNARGAGFLFRARAENGELKADVFVDLERAKAVEGAEQVVNQVESGEPGELSTGFGTTVDEAPGVHNGEHYDLVLRGVRPDHLALLPDEIGACSVADGCGLGVNKGACNCQPKPEQGLLARAVEKLTNALKRRGLFPDASNESDEDRRRLLHSALVDRFGGQDVYIWIEAVFSDDGYLVYEREAPSDAGLFQIDFEIGEGGSVTLGDPREVRRVTTFEPVATNAGDPPEGGNNMDREQMIAQLAEGGPLGKEDLAKLSDAQLQALHAAGEAAGEAAENTAAAQPTTADADAVNALLEEIKGLRSEVATLKDATAPAVEERERERTALVEELAGNERVPFGKDELGAMPVENLRKIRAMARGENYAGRGGPKVGTNAEPAFADPVPYWADNAKED